MKLTEIKEYLKDYDRTTTSGTGLGCRDIFVVTNTNNLQYGFSKDSSDDIRFKECDPAHIVETHFEQIKEVQKEFEGYVMYVRLEPSLKEGLDNEGELSGQYQIRARLQFGIKGKCITQEQYDHLFGNVGDN